MTANVVIFDALVGSRYVLQKHDVQTPARESSNLISALYKIFLYKIFYII